MANQQTLPRFESGSSSFFRFERLRTLSEWVGGCQSNHLVMRALFFSAFLFIASSKSFAQDQHMIDSLTKALVNAKDDTAKVKTLNMLSRQLWLAGENERSRMYAEEQLHLAQKLNFKRGEEMALANRGITYENQGNYADALKDFLSVIKISEEIGSKTGMANGHLECGNVYYLQGNAPEALKNYMKARDFNEQAGEKSGVGNAYMGMGAVYMQQNNFNDALAAFASSLKIQQELGNRRGIAYCYGNMALLNYYQRNYADALRNNFAALEICKETGDDLGITNAYNTMAIIYYSQGNYADALHYNMASLKMKEKTGDKMGMAVSYINLGQVNTRLRNFATAKKYLNDALTLSKEIGYKEGIRDTYQSLADLDSTSGDYGESLANYKFFTLYKDSLINEASNRHLNEMKTKYESEQKDKEISLLTKDKQISALEIKKQTWLRNSLIAGLVLMSIILFFMYRSYHTRQQLKLQTLRNKIASDLHDDVGSTLSSISIFSEIAQQQSNEVTPMLRQIGDSSRKMLEAMADIVWTINPENDQFEKIIDRMRLFAFELLGAKKIDFEFQADDAIAKMKLPMNVRQNVYLIFKEATNNMVKYSDANKVLFSIRRTSGNLMLTIRDNGKGFDVNHATQGNGLKNMKKRAEDIGARLLLESEPGAGTTIQLILNAA